MYMYVSAFYIAGGESLPLYGFNTHVGELFGLGSSGTGLNI